MWDHIMINELANFPLSVHNRIPNFKGATQAAQRILDLPEFKKAKVIKINPDKPQEPVRFLALEANKEILVPIPRLKSGLFLHVAPNEGINKEALKHIATRRGLQHFGKPLGLDSKIKVLDKRYKEQMLKNLFENEVFFLKKSWEFKVL